MIYKIPPLSTLLSDNRFPPTLHEMKQSHAKYQDYILEIQKKADELKAKIDTYSGEENGR